MSHFVDPKFTCHLTVAKVAGYIMLLIGDSPMIPMDPKDYGKALTKGATDLKKLLEQKGGTSLGANTSKCTDSIIMTHLASQIYVFPGDKLQSSGR